MTKHLANHLNHFGLSGFSERIMSRNDVAAMMHKLVMAASAMMNLIEILRRTRRTCMQMNLVHIPVFLVVLLSENKTFVTKHIQLCNPILPYPSTLCHASHRRFQNSGWGQQ